MGESFQKLNLTNAYLFAAALQDEEICRNLLEIVLNKEIPRVKAHAEHTLFLDSDFKSVRFDVYASDEDEVSYDVEMQNTISSSPVTLFLSARLTRLARADISMCLRSTAGMQAFCWEMRRRRSSLIPTEPIRRT